MADNVQQFKVDSKGAQADLLALSKALDTSAASAGKMDKAFASMALNASANLTKAAKAMEKYVAAANLLSKIDIGRSQAAQLRELGTAIDSLGRARTITLDKITSLRGLGAALKQIRMPERLAGIIPFLNELGRIRAPSMATIKNIEGLFVVLNNFKELSTPQAASLARLSSAISTLRAPTPASIANLERLFVVLREAKEIPAAGRIISQLDSITSAAMRASRALSSMPRAGGLASLAGGGLGGGIGGGGGGYGGGAPSSAANSARGLNTVLAESETRVARTRASYGLLSSSVNMLGTRFRVTSQLGSVMNLMFAGMTLGGFVKAIYGANIQLLKLQKALLFSTGTFDGAEKGTDTFIKISNELGLSVKDNIETYSRFVIAAKASNVSLEQTNSIYHALGTAMAVVGSTSQQQQLAFYGLTEMMQKGVVYSKEFNRQIGAQLPGNAVLGARALSKLEGHAVTVAEFFQKMHSGMLQSARFIPQWAAEVEKMYKPLLPLAQLRPDTAIRRLQNAFVSLSREAGKGGFMVELSKQLNSITRMIVDADGHLTPFATHLIQGFGQNLATLIHGAGTAFHFLATHIDETFFAIEAFLGLKLLAGIQKWVGGIAQLAEGFSKLTTKIKGVTAAEEEQAAASTASTVANATSVEAKTAAIVATGGGFGRRAPLSQFTAAAPLAYNTVSNQFGKRDTDLPLFGWAARQSALNKVAPVAGEAVEAGAFNPRAALAARGLAGFGATEAVEGAAAGASGGLSGFIGMLGGVGTVATAAAVALGLLGIAISGINTGDKTPSGSNIKYGDIEMGALSEMWDSMKGVFGEIADAFSNITNAFMGFVGSSKKGGSVLIDIVAMIESVFKALYVAVAFPVRAIVTAAKVMTDALISLGKVMFYAVTGQITAAIKAAHDFTTRSQQATGDFWSGVKRDTTNVGPDAIAAAIEKRAILRADARNRGAGGEDAELRKRMEAAQVEQAAMQKIEDAATQFYDASALFKGAVQSTSFADVFKRAQAVVSGQSFTTPSLRSGEISPTQDKRFPHAALASETIAQIVAAATSVGVNAGIAEKIAFMESAGTFNPKIQGPNGSTALGVMQINNTQYRGLSTPEMGGPFDRTNAYESTRRQLQSDLDDMHQFMRKTGTQLDDTFLYIFHNLGRTAASSLLSAFYSETGRTKSVSQILPQNVITGNKGLYMSGGKPVTVMQAVGNLLDVAGDSRYQNYNKNATNLGIAVPGAVGMTSDQAAKLHVQYDQEQKQVTQHTAQANPLAAAQAKLDEFEEWFATMQGKDQALSQSVGPGYKSVFVDRNGNNQLPAMLAEEARLKDLVTQASGPIAYQAKLEEESNKVLSEKLHGMGDLADYHAEINKLIKEGYTQQQVDNEAAQKAFLLAAQHKRNLESELEVAKSLLAIDEKRSARQSNSPFQNLMTTQYASAQLPGDKSLSDVMKHISPEQQAAFAQNAQAQLAEQAQASMQTINSGNATLAAAWGLNPEQKGIQDSYRTFLQQITGLSTDSLDRLEAAANDTSKRLGINITDFAKQAAELKQQLENPPGFQKWVDGLEPFAKRMEDIKASFMDSLSTGITDALSGDTVDWGAMAKDLNKQIMKAQVDQTLAGILKGTGLAPGLSPEQQAQMQAAQSALNAAQGQQGAATEMSTAATTLNTAGTQLQTAAQMLANTAGGAAGVNSAVTGAANSASNAGASASQFFSQMSSGTATGVTGGSASVTPPGDNPLGLNLSPNFSNLITTMPQLPGISPAGASATPTSGGSSMFGSMGSMGGMMGNSMMGAALNAFHDLNPGTAPDGNKYKANPGAAALGSLGLVGNVLSSIFFPMQEETKPTYHMPNGIIGNMSTNTVNATQIAASTNPIAQGLDLALQMAVSAATGGMGGGMGSMFSSGGFLSNMMNGGGGATSNSILSFLGMQGAQGDNFDAFSNAGLSPMGMPSQWLQFADGTANTSGGGFPAILHPDEAVIPLPNGRHVPVQMNGNGGDTHLHSTVNVTTPDVGGFRKSRGAIARDQNRILKRNSIRNQPGYH